MKQVKIYCPFNQPHNGYRLIFEDKLSNIVGGYTRYNTIGLYRNKAGQLEQEAVYVYEIIVNPSLISQLYSLAKEYGIACNQESVLITESHIEACLLEKGKDYA